MLKHKLVVIVFLIIGMLTATAQEDGIYKAKKEKSKIESLQRPFIISLSIGPNFNTGGNDYSEWFGSRADVVTQLDWRMNYAFAQHWGVHLDVGISFFNVQTNNLGDQIGVALMNTLFPGLSKIKPSISTGITYFAEKGKWQFMPRAGIGLMSAGNSDKTKTNDGKEYRLEINRSPMFFNTGASIGYRTSNLCSVIFDINYRYPMKSSKTIYTTTSSNLPSVVETMKSRSWTNDLSVSLGIQFQADMRKKKTSSAPRSL